MVHWDSVRYGRSSGPTLSRCWSSCGRCRPPVTTILFCTIHAEWNIRVNTMSFILLHLRLLKLSCLVTGNLLLSQHTLIKSVWKRPIRS